MQWGGGSSWSAILAIRCSAAARPRSFQHSSCQRFPCGRVFSMHPQAIANGYGMLLLLLLLLTEPKACNTAVSAGCAAAAQGKERSLAALLASAARPLGLLLRPNHWRRHRCFTRLLPIGLPDAHSGSTIVIECQRCGELICDALRQLIAHAELLACPRKVTL